MAAVMPEIDVPLDVNVSALVRFLDKVDYQDDNFPDRDKRLKTLQDVWTLTAKHFDHKLQQRTLDISPRKVEIAMRTSVQLVVYCWTKVRQQVMVDLCIYFVYIILFDDSHASSHKPESHMDTFFPRLFSGRQQEHPFWRLMNEHLSVMLQHYGSFCQVAIFRSTLDWYQGCWVESQSFLGFPGSDCYPLFLRRLTALGHISGASLFTKDQFEEKDVLEEIATMLAQFEPFIAFVNDLVSFYKEVNDAEDQVNLIRMYCRVEGMTGQQAFDRLTSDTIRCVERLRLVFNKEKYPAIEEMMNAFIQGYVTWHFCDERYRMREIYERVGLSEDGIKFRHYYDAIMEAGWFDIPLWAKSLEVDESVDDDHGKE